MRKRDIELGGFYAIDNREEPWYTLSQPERHPTIVRKATVTDLTVAPQNGKPRVEVSYVARRKTVKRVILCEYVYMPWDDLVAARGAHAQTEARLARLHEENVDRVRRLLPEAKFNGFGKYTVTVDVSELGALLARLEDGQADSDDVDLSTHLDLG